jgi:hypothetical protein
MIECAHLKSGTRQDHGRITAYLSKQARYDNQPTYPLVVFVGGRQPAPLRLIEPRSALAFVRDSSPLISPIIATHIYSQGTSFFSRVEFLSRRTFVKAKAEVKREKR